MNSNGDSPAPDDLAARLRETESRLAVLESERVDAAYARQLRGALTRLAVLGELAAPVGHNALLELLVRTAAQVLQAQAASLLLLDRATNELVFEVALGSSAAEASKFRVPVGQGIAGWVAASGQPVARSDVAQDTRHAGEMADRIGYHPKSVLAIPLRSDDEVIGVIELFDKANGQPFNNDDMETLDQFGRAAAVAIEQATVLSDLTRLFTFVLQRLLGDSPDTEGLRTQAAEVVARTVQSEQFRDAVEIAIVLGEIGQHGANERRLLLEQARGLAAYFREQQQRSTLGGWLQ